MVDTMLDVAKIALYICGTSICAGITVVVVALVGNFVYGVLKEIKKDNNSN